MHTTKLCMFNLKVGFKDDIMDVCRDIDLEGHLVPFELPSMVFMWFTTQRGAAEAKEALERLDYRLEYAKVKKADPEPANSPPIQSITQSDCPVPSPADLLQDVPQVLSSENAQYNRMQSIGSGSYGKCYVVTNRKTNERLACKIISKEVIQDEVSDEMVKSEIHLHRKLAHEHVVAFVESFTDTHHIYIVQALCTNGSLGQIMVQRQRIFTFECRYCLFQILKGIDYIHSQGIIHRDLKVANILVDANMQMKICDFGLAILEREAHLEADILCGTTNYLAPEVINLNGFERRSDIWAIGVIAFILLYGNKPFEADTGKMTFDRIARADYRLPSYVDQDLKSFFRNVFEANVKNRSNAFECLKLNFFQSYVIPASLSILPHLEKSSAMDISASSKRNGTAIRPEIKCQNAVDYPSVLVTAKFTPMNSMGNDKHFEVLQAVFKRFDKICSSDTIKNDASFSKFTRLPDQEPNYWIVRWTYDDKSIGGFAYQTSDLSIGTLFEDGFHFMQAPDQTNFSVSSSGRLLRIGDPRGRVEPYLKKVSEFGERLIQNGICEAATAHNRSNLPHLITWFQTEEAMVMFSSNHTVQINLTASHKKVIICPDNETITFVSNKICRENFKTVTFDTLAAFGFSANDLNMFKFITASIKHLMLLLLNE